MSKNVLKNKTFLMNHTFNRKKMYKSGKQWMVTSALVLALLGGGAVAGHTATTHAAGLNSAASTQATNHKAGQQPVTSNSEFIADKANQTEAKAKVVTQQIEGTKATQPASSASVSHGFGTERATNQSSQSSSSSVSSSASSQARPKMMFGATRGFGTQQTLPKSNVYLANGSDNEGSFAVSGSANEAFKVQSSASNMIDAIASNGNVIGSTTMPSDFHLASNSDNFVIQPNKLKPSIVQLDIDNGANNPYTNSDIPVAGNTVDFKGNIVLNFPDYDKNDKTTNNTKTITIPYSDTTAVSHQLSDILQSGTINGYPNPTVPTDYLHKIIDKFNTSNYSYPQNSTPVNKYKNVYVQPADATDNMAHVTDNGNGNYTYQNPDITFNFTANNVPEKIKYQYTSGKSNFIENSGSASQVISGANNSLGSVTSSIASSANASGALKPGWHINSNANFVYGNSGSDANSNANDTVTVQVSPNSASATINYVLSDASASSNGSTIASSVVSGNDYRATQAGNNAYVFNSSNATNSSASGNNKDGLPAGYHVVVSDGHGHEVPLSGNNSEKIPFDNGNNHIVKIQGNMHNGAKNGKAKTSTPSTTPPNTTNPKASDYVPANDVVTVIAHEYNDKGTEVGTKRTYVTESGRTGESYQIKPSDYIPSDYKEDSGDKIQNGTFIATGVNTPKINFNYDASTGNEITVKFLDQHGHPVQSDTFKGTIDDTGDVIGRNGKYTVPTGYHYTSAKYSDGTITNSDNVGYQITNKDQTITINIAGNPYVPSDNSSKNNGGNKPQPAPRPKPIHKPTNNNGGGKSKVKPNGSDGGKNPQGSKDTPNKPTDADYTFYVTVNDFPSDNPSAKTVRSYQVQLVEKGTVGESFTINPSDYATNGYTEDGSDGQYIGHFGAKYLEDNNYNQRNSVVWNFHANAQTGYINYVDQNGKPINKKPIQINGHTDETINNVTTNNGNNQSTIPSGYHANTKGNNSNYSYQFNGPSSTNTNEPSPTYQLQGNYIKGNATLHLIYSDGNGNPATKDVQIPINTQVGNSDEISPYDYAKPGYKLAKSDSVWSIPLNSSIAPTGDNTSYNPSHTFRYTTSEPTVTITYVDVDKDADKQAIYDTVNKGSVKFNGHTYPIIGTQYLGTIGHVGQVVDLIPKGDQTTNSNEQAVLVAPSGYHLVSDSNPKLIPMTSLTIKPGINNHIVGLSFYSANPFTPSKHTNSSANKPTSKASSATSSKASSGSAVKPNSANSSVAPSASGKTNNGSASAKSGASVKPSNASGTSANSSANVKPSDNSSANNSANGKSTNSASSAIPSGNSASANSAQSSNVVPSASSATPSSVQPEFIITPNNSGSVAPSASASNTSASGSVASASDNNTANTSDVAPTSSASDNNTETNSDIPVLKNNTQPNTQPESDNIINPDNVVTPSNVIPSDNNVVNAEPTNAQSPIFSNVPSDNEALANNTVATPNNNTATGKLPQTNEATNYAGITAMVALMLGIGLAGVDLKRRYE